MRRHWATTVPGIAIAVLLIAGALGRTPAAAGKADILWDHYGVPHIFAPDRESMFYAEGWAQMENQANLLLRLYGESRGRGAEYWGPSALELDRWVQLNGVPERAREWYDRRRRPSGSTSTSSPAASTTTARPILKR